MVPVAPQSLDELRARYPAAVEPTYELDDVESGRIPPPSKDPRHVFDFEDGLRLIVSRENFLIDSGPLIHFSASISDPSPLWERADRMVEQGNTRRHMALWLKQIAVDRFRDLACDSTCVIECVAYRSPKGIPHFVVNP